MMRLLSRGPVITRLRVEPPDPAPGRDGIALVAIMRNEARHAGEWAAFHRAAGVGHLFLYDDGSMDGTADAVCAAMPQTTVIPWAQRFEDAREGWRSAGRLHNQIAAYVHAVANFGARWRWMACLDADEFLLPTGAPTLPEALAGLEVTNVSLPWHMFGRGGREAKSAATVPTFLRRSRSPMDPTRGASGFKCLFDPCALRIASVHEMRTEGDRTWNDAGREATFATRRDPAFLSTDRVQLNHYYTRSAADLEAKLSRGSNLADPAYRRRVMRAGEAIERDEVEEHRAADWWAARRPSP